MKGGVVLVLAVAVAAAGALRLGEPVDGAVELVSTGATVTGPLEANWDKVPAPEGVVFKSITTVINSVVFALDTKGHLYQFDGTKWARSEPDVEVPRRAVDLGCDGTLWMLDDKGSLWKKFDKKSDGPWYPIGKGFNMKTLAVGNGLDVWGTDASDNVVAYIAPTKKMRAYDQKAIQIAVGCKGDVWAVAPRSNALFEFVPKFNKWIQRGDRIAQVQRGHQVYLRGTGKVVWAYRSADQQEEKVTESGIALK